MTRMLVVALGLSAVFAAPALAADPNYKVVDRIKMSDGGWDYIVADADNGRIYRTRADGADVVDVKTGKVSQLTSTGNGHMVVVVPGTTRGVVPLRSPAKTVRIVDTATDKIVADVAGGEGPDGATYDPFSKHVFVANHNGGDVTEVDPVAGKAVATIAIGGGKLEFPAADGAGHVFVNRQEKGEIAVIDVKDHKVSATYKMAGCEDNSGLAYADKAKLLIASCGNGVAKVVAADGGKEVASLPIGKGPELGDLRFPAPARFHPLRPRRRAGGHLGRRPGACGGGAARDHPGSDPHRRRRSAVGTHLFDDGRVRSEQAARRRRPPDPEGRLVRDAGGGPAIRRPPCLQRARAPSGTCGAEKVQSGFRPLWSSNRQNPGTTAFRPARSRPGSLRGGRHALPKFHRPDRAGSGGVGDHDGRLGV